MQQFFQFQYEHPEGKPHTLRVFYRNVCLAKFTTESDDHPITELDRRAREYVKTYGYLAEWRYQSICQGKIVSWTEDMRTLHHDA